jgi:hypothetical protein
MPLADRSAKGLTGGEIGGSQLEIAVVVSASAEPITLTPTGPPV